MFSARVICLANVENVLKLNNFVWTGPANDYNVICDRNSNTCELGLLECSRGRPHQDRKSGINWKFLQLCHFCSDLIFDEAPKQKRLVLLYWITLGVLGLLKEQKCNIQQSYSTAVLNSGLIQVVVTRKY